MPSLEQGQPLVTPMSTSTAHKDPMTPEVFKCCEARSQEIMKAQCGNDKLDVTEECGSPNEGCQGCRVVPGYLRRLQRFPFTAKRRDRNAVTLEGFDAKLAQYIAGITNNGNQRSGATCKAMRRVNITSVRRTIRLPELTSNRQKLGGFGEVRLVGGAQRSICHLGHHPRLAEALHEGSPTRLRLAGQSAPITAKL